MGAAAATAIRPSASPLKAGPSRPPYSEPPLDMTSHIPGNKPKLVVLLGGGTPGPLLLLKGPTLLLLLLKGLARVEGVPPAPP